MPAHSLAPSGMLLVISTNNQLGRQGMSKCDAALAPTIESATSDYAILQSYMYVNAEHEYEKLKSASAEQRSASGSYKFFSAELEGADTSSKFQKMVHDRLAREGYSMNEANSRASYRRSLTKEQLEAWSSCIKAASAGGAVILTAESVSNSEFPVRVRWDPQKGVGSGTLQLYVQNATIDGLNKISVHMSGMTERSFIVVPDSSQRQIVLVANIAASTDDLCLPRAFPKAKARITVAAADFVNPLNVALGGPDKMYGADVLLNASPYHSGVPNRADFEFNASAAGTYVLKVEYAAAEARPVTIRLNGSVAIDSALGAPTGSWNSQTWLNQGRVTLLEGLNVLRVERDDIFPHIRTFVFEPADDPVAPT